MKENYKPFQWDGCGCTWYENRRGKRKLEKCGLHKKNPRAFGGLLISDKKEDDNV